MKAIFKREMLIISNPSNRDSKIFEVDFYHEDSKSRMMWATYYRYIGRLFASYRSEIEYLNKRIYFGGVDKLINREVL